MTRMVTCHSFCGQYYCKCMLSVPYLHRNGQAEAGSGEGGGSAAPKKVMDMVRLRGVRDYGAGCGF